MSQGLKSGEKVGLAKTGMLLEIKNSVMERAV